MLNENETSANGGKRISKEHKYKKTTRITLYKEREYKIYEGKRGGEYIKVKGGGYKNIKVLKGKKSATKRRAKRENNNK